MRRRSCSPESLPLLKLVSEVGLIVFMFLIGLELDPKLLRGRGHASVIISHTSIVVPFALGGRARALPVPAALRRLRPVLVVHAVHGRGDEHHGVPGAGAHPHRAAPAGHEGRRPHHHLRRRRRRDRLVHPRVRRLDRRATRLEGAVWTTVFAVAYIAGMLFLVRPFLARLGARGSSKEGLSQDVVAVTLRPAASCRAGLTEMIGIHPLFGAFMLGAIMPRAPASRRASPRSSRTSPWSSCSRCSSPQRPAHADRAAQLGRRLDDVRPHHRDRLRRQVRRQRRGRPLHRPELARGRRRSAS